MTMELLEFPNEILFKIGSFLGKRDLENLGHSNIKLHGIVKHIVDKERVHSGAEQNVPTGYLPTPLDIYIRYGVVSNEAYVNARRYETDYGVRVFHVAMLDNSDRFNQGDPRDRPYIIERLLGEYDNYMEIYSKRTRTDRFHDLVISTDARETCLGLLLQDKYEKAFVDLFLVLGAMFYNLFAKRRRDIATFMARHYEAIVRDAPDTNAQRRMFHWMERTDENILTRSLAETNRGPPLKALLAYVSNHPKNPYTKLYNDKGSDSMTYPLWRKHETLAMIYGSYHKIVPKMIVFDGSEVQESFHLSIPTSRVYITGDAPNEDTHGNIKAAAVYVDCYNGERLSAVDLTISSITTECLYIQNNPNLNDINLSGVKSLKTCRIAKNPRLVQIRDFVPKDISIGRLSVEDNPELAMYAMHISDECLMSIRNNPKLAQINIWVAYSHSDTARAILQVDGGVPSLEKIDITGNILTIDVRDAPKLRSILGYDGIKSLHLAHLESFSLNPCMSYRCLTNLHIENIPSLTTIDVLLAHKSYEKIAIISNGNLIGPIEIIDQRFLNVLKVKNNKMVEGMKLEGLRQLRELTVVHMESLYNFSMKECGSRTGITSITIANNSRLAFFSMENQYEEMGRITIKNNDALQLIPLFPGITAADRITITGNGVLGRIHGFAALEWVRDCVRIAQNAGLVSVNGFYVLHSAPRGFIVQQNPKLNIIDILPPKCQLNVMLIDNDLLDKVTIATIHNTRFLTLKTFKKLTKSQWYECTVRPSKAIKIPLLLKENYKLFYM